MENKIKATWRSGFGRIVYAIFTSGLQDPDNVEQRGRIIFFNILVFIGMAVLVPFAISRFLIGEWFLGSVDLLTAAMLAAIAVFHRVTRRLMLSRILGLGIMSLLYGYLAVSTGDHDTGFLWSYCLPLDVVFLLDRKRGSIFITIYLLIMTACFITPVFPAYHHYSVNLKIVYLISFLTVWVIAYYFEYIMSTLQHEVVNNNIRMQLTINELRETKDQLFQSQKMEAIGRLAGGVAHDFNNILAAISGYAELLQQKFAATDPKIDKYATSIINSSKRAADLTAKLLAYARKGKIEMAVVNINKVVEDVIDICKHTMSKKIILNQRLDAGGAMILGDRNQLQNALTNLAVNAQDAMPDGGTLSFTTEIIELSENSLGNPVYAAMPGHYLKCTVTDTGAGMDEHTLARAIEPFFTTKEKGKGTGLGLPSVYSTIKSHTGYFELKSVPGKGTSAEIYLPLTTSTEQKAAEGARNVSTGQGRILLVDDEDVVRNMMSEMISAMGYSTITCGDGQEALDFYKSHSREIDLVVLDVIMPRLGGYDTFMAMKAVNPELKAIAISGYIVNEEVNKMLEQGTLAFLPKPFDTKLFSTAIHDALQKA
ncbi:MAG: response regulator [Chitinivibrionales bacterium]|nr:response regulator [Chitinivibrionales bacterium]